MKIEVVTRELTVGPPPEGGREFVALRLSAVGGRVVQEDDRRVVAKFGRAWLVRFLGELWVSRSLLPKEVTVRFKEGADGLALRISVADANKWLLIKVGVRKKTQQALEETAELVLSALEHGD